VFELAPDSGIDRISTRVRVDSYTNLHAVAEMSDGSLYVAQRFIKAAGGCSAPALKQVAGDVPIGTMRFRQFPDTTGHPGAAEAELMIRHPNYSGMQMDQLTRYYIPAHFVRSVTIWRANLKLLSVGRVAPISRSPCGRGSGGGVLGERPINQKQRISASACASRSSRTSSVVGGARNSSAR
jgi:sulfur-oxidizing protein SoxY